MRRIASSLIVALLVSSLFAFVLIVKPARADVGTIYIRADGSIDPPTAPISTFDNITYTLTGDIVNDSIVVERDYIVVDGAGYTIQGPGYLRGLDLSGRINVTARNMNIEGFYEGVSLGLNCTVSDSTLANSDYGVYLDSSSGNTVSGNNLTNNGDGVWLVSNSIYNTVSGNDITDNYDGVLISFYSGLNTVSGNNITGNRDSGVWAEDSSNDTVSGNNITANSPFGVYFGPSANNTLSGNVFVDDGLFVGDSYSNAVADNWVNGKPLVYLENVSDTTVRDAGQVILINCNGIRVENLNLSNATIGVELSGTNGTTVSGNNFTNNAYGVGLFSSFNNTFYHNNFVNNSLQVSHDYGANVWDDGYPSGGNYWSDYTGTDLNSGTYQNVTGSDGIGDTAYTIDFTDIDNYPLMAPFAMSSFVVNLAGNATPINVEVVSNSTVSNVQVDETARILSFNVSGETGTSGFSRITVPNIIVESFWNGTYTLLLNGEPWPFTSSSDAQNTYIYINYTHSEHQVIILPEFPSNLFIAALMMSTILYVMISKRRKKSALIPSERAQRSRNLIFRDLKQNVGRWKWNSQKTNSIF